MIRGILFDMDGLMFDTEAIGYRGWKEAGRRLGIRIDDEAIAALRGLGDREKREMFGRMTGRPEEYEKALAVRVDYADQWISENGLPVKPGLKELLCFLKEEKIPAALATSTERKKPCPIFAWQMWKNILLRLCAGRKREIRNRLRTFS